MGGVKSTGFDLGPKMSYIRVIVSIFIHTLCICIEEMYALLFTDTIWATNAHIMHRFGVIN